MNPTSSKPVALVTGATRGIGRAIALELAHAGFAVVATGRTMREGEGDLGSVEHRVPVPGSLESTVAAIEATGGEALGVRLDLLDRASIDAGLEAALALFGRLDVLVNNAIYQGPEMMRPLADVSMEAAEDSFRGMVVNQAYISRQAIQAMKAGGGGRIICVTSLASLLPPNENIGFLYAAGKAAFNKLPEYIQHEHGADGVLAFLIEPQFTMTDTMRARWGEQADAIGQGVEARRPEETARTVAWLAAHPDAGRFAGGRLLNAPDFFSLNGIAPPDGAPIGDRT